MASLTEAQLEAALKAKELLSEHFEAALIVISADIDDNREYQCCFYHGGGCMAKGLAQVAVEQLRDRVQSESD